MAWKVTKRIWNTAREIKQSDKLLLLALAEFADEQSVCWPSYETLAEMIGVNRRSAIRIVENLEEWGHIYIDQHAVGRSNTNTFLIVTGLTPPEVEKVLIDRFGKSPDDANLSTNSLMGKQDDYRKGVTHNTKSFPESGRYKRPKGVKADTKSVTDNTISHSQKGVMREQKVLPVTQKGVMDDTRTIKEPSIKPTTRDTAAQKLEIIYLLGANGRSSQSGVDLVNDMLNTYPAEVIIYACAEAEKNTTPSDDKRNLKYIEAVCKRKVSGQPDKIPRSTSPPPAAVRNGNAPPIDTERLERLKAGKE